MLKEFKDFAIKGNVVDLAVAVVVGGAFGKIVTSLVNDIIMPLFGAIMGGINFTDLKIVMKAAVGDTPEVALKYGAFIQAIVDFLIISFGIFMFIKIIDKLKRLRSDEGKAESAPPAPTETEKLLSEIRDLLKDR